MQDLTDMLAEIIASLAPIPRLPTSDGERRAAIIIRDRFAAAACAARIETVPAYDSYARPLGTLCAAAALAGLLADTTASTTRASRSRDDEGRLDGSPRVAQTSSSR